MMTGSTASRWLGLEARWRSTVLPVAVMKSPVAPMWYLTSPPPMVERGSTSSNLVKISRERAADGVDHDVEAAAVAHGEDGAVDAEFGGGGEELVEERDEGGEAFEREALGAEVALLDDLLEEVGADEVGEDARAGFGGGVVGCSSCCWIHARFSGEGMCMNSAPMDAAVDSGGLPRRRRSLRRARAMGKGSGGRNWPSGSSEAWR